jgi:hypothetical protein
MSRVRGVKGRGLGRISKGVGDGEERDGDGDGDDKDDEEKSWGKVMIKRGGKV